MKQKIHWIMEDKDEKTTGTIEWEAVFSRISISGGGGGGDFRHGEEVDHNL